MKYIRTKDGIFDKVDETLVLASLPPKYELTKNGVHVGYEYCKNCRLADTIEELFDSVVYRPTQRIKGLFDSLEQAVEYYEQSFPIFDYKHWFGALDTDKGLIYVAKMNRKGEWELL